MTSTELQERRIAVVLDYFHRVDHADPTLVDLYTDDAVVYFPKLGTARGKGEIAVLAQASLPKSSRLHMTSTTSW